jgi:hypothetical protein
LREIVYYGSIMTEKRTRISEKEQRAIADSELAFDGQLGIVIGPPLEIHPVAKRKLLELRSQRQDSAHPSESVEV